MIEKKDRFTVTKKYICTDPEKNKMKSLASDRAHLVPCTYIPGDSFFELSFSTSGLMHFRASEDLESHEKLNLLINAGKLYELSSEFGFSMSPDNLFFDEKLNVFVLERTVIPDPPGRFAEKYKALIFSVICPEYSYEDYILGERHILLNDDSLKEIAETDKLERIMDILSLKLTQLNRKRDKKYTEISRRRIFLMKLSVTLSLLTVLLIFFMSYTFVSYHKNISHSIACASSSFISEDYKTAFSKLKDVPENNMTKEIMYIAAYSAVTLQPLKDGKKEEILENISSVSDTSYLKYWISLEKKNYKEARMHALKLKNQEMIDYADACSLSN